MARYTKENMARDTVNLLRGEFSDFLKDKAMEKILWAATELRYSDFPENIHIPSSAKYTGCKFWSEEALLQAYGIRTINELTTATSFSKKGLRHEHVIPKSVMRDSLQKWANDKAITDEDLYTKILEVLNLAVACVVTEDQAEDSLDTHYKNSMPEGKGDISDSSNTWARYEKLGIKVYKVTWKIVKGSWVIDKFEEYKI